MAVSARSRFPSQKIRKRRSIGLRLCPDRERPTEGTESDDRGGPDDSSTVALLDHLLGGCLVCVEDA